MEEKMFGYMLNMGLAVDKCMGAVEENQKALIKQAMINKKQKIKNVITFALVFTCADSIYKLVKIVKHQDARIEELETKINGDKPKGE